MSKFRPAPRALLHRLALSVLLLPVLPVLPAAALADDSPIEAANLPLPLEEVRLFAEVFNQIRSAYVEEIDDRTLLENAIKGMLSGIDPHSTFLDGDDFEQLQESTTGEYGGLGVEIGIENGYIRVIAPIDGSPADRAGLEPGDLIIQLDDKPSRDITLSDTMDVMRGEPGTDITLTILREGVLEPFEVTLTREIITAHSVRSRSLEPGYGYIRIAQFATKTGEEVHDALSRLQAEEELKGLVLDLRNNPGGVLQSSVEVVDAFLSQGLIVYTEGRVENAHLRFEANAADPSRGVPLVVLINGGSASASEIVAGALQDHRRAIVMGTPSFGKGSVQTVLPLTNERAIKLTTALYYTPGGRSIQAKGIEPDILIESGQVTRARGSASIYREADLRNHLETLEQGSAPTSGDAPEGTQGTQAPTDREGRVNVLPLPPDSGHEVIARDYQLQEALNVLKGLNIYRAAERPAYAQAGRDEQEE